jgi:hypothetical protein
LAVAAQLTIHSQTLGQLLAAIPYLALLLQRAAAAAHRLQLMAPLAVLEAQAAVVVAQT